MFYNLRTNASRWNFARRTAGIIQTPPLAYRESDLTILSQTRHDDVGMHLLAVKSFYARMGHGKIVIIDDGSLTEQDKEIFRHHFVAPDIVPLKSIDLDGLIPGNTWERLAHSIDLCQTSFVIQLDSDILTVGAVDEVKNAIASNRSFILGTWNGLKTVPVAEASDFADKLSPASAKHIQSLCERSLRKLANPEKRRYVRGSSGFYGFAKRAVSRSDAADFCREMLEIVGERFHEWGSEQFASNYLVANAPNSLVLPYPRYACFGPELNPGMPSLFHFIGAFRFTRGIYARRAHQVIRELNGV